MHLENFLTGLHNYFGSIYVPKRIAEREEPIVLHLSDTPFEIHNAIKRLLKKLNPEYIMHTGDLVDNIKLERKSNLIEDYRFFLPKILETYIEYTQHKLFIALGNHDDLQTLTKICTENISLVPDVSTFSLEGNSFTISHYCKRVQVNPSEFNLYGHNQVYPDFIPDHQYYLNGIHWIHIIGLKSKQITYLPYPYGTDDFRFLTGRIGL